MINVLRIGHRIDRDKRITTHVCLVARAFGADKIYIDNQDKKIENNIKSIVKRFGGNFQIQTGIDSKKIVKNWNGTIVHLTMYGEELNKSIGKINKKKNILIIVGAEKVPPYFYINSDINISVGNQPHSEVAALAIFLDRYTNSRWLNKKFNGKVEIIPYDNGKKVISKKIDWKNKMDEIPSSRECINLLKKKGCSMSVINHCLAVKDASIKIAKKTNANLKLIRAGSILHDIGRSKTHGIKHAVEGAKIAKELGLPKSIISIIERHIGAGITSKEARELGLPVKNYLPVTLEEKIICYADSLINNNIKQNIESEIGKALNDGLKQYARRLKILHRELSEICGIDLDKI
jgi:tRNA (cytidine56-2'-O)-methyltransferase